MEQPITEEFRKRAGALLLTHSGTEGRNLQFCHRLANFDLPWNPMEIEQRIGRLHRLGQRQPVRIYNFVQAGTLQEHLLEVLQEKLNLFELIGVMGGRLTDVGGPNAPLLQHSTTPSAHEIRAPHPLDRRRGGLLRRSPHVPWRVVRAHLA